LPLYNLDDGHDNNSQDKETIAHRGITALQEFGAVIWMLEIRQRMRKTRFVVVVFAADVDGSRYFDSIRLRWRPSI